MKLLHITIFLSVMFVCPSWLYAEDDPGLEYCKDVSVMAREIMEKRQEGAPLEQLIEEFSRADVYGARYLAESISNEAYSFPLVTDDFRGVPREGIIDISIVMFAQKYQQNCNELYWFYKGNF